MKDKHCPAWYIYMPLPILFIILLYYHYSSITIYKKHSMLHSMYLIIWILKDPTNLDAHCLQNVISGFSRTQVNGMCSHSLSIALSFNLTSVTFSFRIRFEPRHEFSNNVVCATSKASDQAGHTPSLIRAFSCRLNILWLLCYRLNIICSF